MRPAKPYPDFPLFAHPTGYWAKKIKGRLHYFGQWGRTIDGIVVPNTKLGHESALLQYQRSVAGRVSLATNVDKHLDAARSYAVEYVLSWPFAKRRIDLPHVGPGVYAIVRDGQVIYVGCTRLTLYARWESHQHRQELKIPDTRVYWAVTTDEQVLRLEAWLISSVDPPLNKEYAFFAGKSSHNRRKGLSCSVENS